MYFFQIETFFYWTTVWIFSDLFMHWQMVKLIGLHTQSELDFDLASSLTLRNLFIPELKFSLWKIYRPIWRTCTPWLFSHITPIAFKQIWLIIGKVNLLAVSKGRQDSCCTYNWTDQLLGIPQTCFHLRICNTGLSKT